MESGVPKAKGLESSMWAKVYHRPYNHSNRFETPRARSYTPPPTTSSTLYANGIVSTGPKSNSTTAALSPLQLFQRFEQACQRLRWKFIDLQNSYARATNPEEAGFTASDAERNFKVDFYEFYAWIEQTLVLVLRIFDVVIPRGEGNGTRGSANHTFHHNVLMAFEDEGNPLHPVLGVGDVHHALWKAKELRNRWKDASEGKQTPPLKMYDLSWVVGQILGGLELGYGLAMVKVQEDMARAAVNGAEDGSTGQTMPGGQDESWDWMVEAMDWES
ncbi:hypothetical protein HJFPF1_07705 [Paramyrothecium foliicola]|nr:hypothetical protein HJFPF1_07705 [Paramyrothecium foliicola]